MNAPLKSQRDRGLSSCSCAPDFCMRLCHHGLQTHTLSLVRCWHTAVQHIVTCQRGGVSIKLPEEGHKFPKLVSPWKKLKALQKLDSFIYMKEFTFWDRAVVRSPLIPKWRGHHNAKVHWPTVVCSSRDTTCQYYDWQAIFQCYRLMYWLIYVYFLDILQTCDVCFH